MRTNRLHISCDSCGIGIGPSYEVKSFFEAGVSFLCPACHRDLLRDKYLLLSDDPGHLNIMLINGEEFNISSTQLEKLRQTTFISSKFTKPLY